MHKSKINCVQKPGIEIINLSRRVEKVTAEEKIKLIDQLIEDFGGTIHSFRVSRCLTLQDMAELVSCSASYVWRIENNRRNPDFDVRIRFLEQAMGFSAEDIYVYLSRFSSREEK